MTGRKIVSAAVQNRTQTPFWNWLRNKLLAVDRQSITPPPGLPTADGKAVYNNPLRFPNTQAARPGSADPPSLPGGVHHQISDNYYFARDGRREVIPPHSLYTVDSQGVKYATAAGVDIAKQDAVKVNKGPEVNFGLDAPTPGFGSMWIRNRAEELSNQRNDPSLKNVERFDKFTVSN